jgi:hypothetical protein
VTPDADVVFLCMINTLRRAAVWFINAGQTVFYVDLLFEYASAELGRARPEQERAGHDFTLVWLLAGNDFLLSWVGGTAEAIAEKFPDVLAAYRNMGRQKEFVLAPDGSIDFPAFGRFLSALRPVFGSQGADPRDFGKVESYCRRLSWVMSYYQHGRVSKWDAGDLRFDFGSLVAFLEQGGVPQPPGPETPGAGGWVTLHPLVRERAVPTLSAFPSLTRLKCTFVPAKAKPTLRVTPAEDALTLSPALIGTTVIVGYPHVVPALVEDVKRQPIALEQSTRRWGAAYGLAPKTSEEWRGLVLVRVLEQGKDGASWSDYKVLVPLELVLKVEDADLQKLRVIERRRRPAK